MQYQSKGAEFVSRRTLASIDFWSINSSLHLYHCHFVPMLPPPPRSKRDEFRRVCQDYLDERPQGGYITDEGARLFRRALRKVRNELPADEHDLQGVARQALSTVPTRSITRRTLERFRLIPRQVAEPELYSGAATGHEYGYRSLVRERIHDGEPQVLVDWEPKWEPISKLALRVGGSTAFRVVWTRSLCHLLKG
jgi:hypothetical protein